MQYRFTQQKKIAYCHRLSHELYVCAMVHMHTHNKQKRGRQCCAQLDEDENQGMKEASQVAGS